MSGLLAKLVHTELLRRAVAAEIACNQQHPDYLDWRDEIVGERENRGTLCSRLLTGWVSG